MKKIRLLMATLAILLSILPARANWNQAETYAGWFPSFQFDKAWQFVSGFRDQDNETYSNQLWGTSTVDCPGVIAWSMMVWNNHKGDDDEYQMDYANVYIYNTSNTNSKMLICKVQFSGTNKNNHTAYQTPTITNYNSNSTTPVNYRWAKNYCDGSEFNYFLTYYSDAIRTFIQNANGHIGVWIETSWDGNSYTNHGILSLADRTLLSLPQPSITNQAWTVYNDQTCVSFNHGLTESGMALKVRENYTGKVSTVPFSSGQTSYYHPNTISSYRDDMYNYQDPKFKYVAYTEKTYSFSTANYYLYLFLNYTSTTLKSTETEFYPPVFAQPLNATASDYKDGRVKVTWQNRSHTANQTYDNSNFIVERATDAAFTQNYTSETVSFTYSTASSNTDYTWYDEFSIRDQGNITFYYRIHRANAEASELNQTVNTIVNTDWAKLSTFSASVDTNNTALITLSWDYDAGIKNSNLKLHITHGNSQLDILTNNGQRSTTISGIPSCVPTTFTAQLQVNQQDKGNPKSTTITRPLDDPGVLDEVIASAGYYNNRVNIIWKVNERHPNFSYFKLLRTGIEDDVMEALGTVDYYDNTMQYSFNDNTCIPGVYYEYKVIGYASCDDTTSQVAEKSSIGFAQPYGVVSGQIAYSGNQAVKDVSVVAEGVGQFNGRSVSLQASDAPSLQIPFSKTCQMLGYDKGTIEFFVSVADESAYSPILKSAYISLENKYKMLRLNAENYSSGSSSPSSSGSSSGTSGDELVVNPLNPDIFNPGGSTVIVDDPGNIDPGININFVPGILSSGTFTHIALTYEKVANTIIVKVYVNGDSVLSKTINWNTSGSIESLFGTEVHPIKTLVFGRNGNDYMTGNFDEIRIWNTVRTGDEIKRYMDTYLSGTETGLTGYYRCDDEVGLTLFDLSKTGNNFNGRHLSMSGVTMDENIVPTLEQLGHKAYTDENGNYLFNNIPYSTNGSLYNVIPMLGIHEFSPSQRPLFFNASANTHNAVDFEDVSSFPVSGKVTFDNTNYPVKGCQFYIDGTTPCTKDGTVIETDENGNYSIEVPIGHHYITVKKTGHTFVNGGRYPATGTVDYQNEVTNLTFKDSTLVLLTGRVAGGADEKNKVHGFSQGKATIGHAEIKLTTHGNYNLNLDQNNARIFTMPTDSVHGSCNSIAQTPALPTSGNSAQYITITTDSSTGEFNVMLPPIDFEVRSIEIPSDENIEFDLSSIGDIPLGTQEVQTRTTDSLATDSGYMYFKYSYALDAIIYNEPTLTVQQNENDMAFGSHYFIYEDKVSAFKDTIDLYTLDADGNVTNYTFGYPCYQSGDTVVWTMKAYETYINNDDNSNPIVTKQPFRYGIVNVSNNIGVQVDNTLALTDTTISVSNSEVATVEGNELMFDSTGTTYYSFVVGEPNILTPYTFNATITYQDAQRTRYYDWDENDNTNAIVLGAKLSGTNFVTKGPDEIFFILRDPMGADSYAEWESGQTVTKTWSNIHECARHETIDNYVIVNTQTTTVAAPVGTGVTFPNVELTNKVGPSETLEGTTQWKDSKQWEFTNSMTVATSQDNGHEMVGTPADIFIGKGTNRLFGNANQVYIKRDTAGNYSIDQKAVLSVETEFGTQFNYTTHYIEDFLLPNLEAMRNQLLYWVPAAQYNDQFVNNTDGSLYITTLTPDDPDYGQNGTYIHIYPDDWMHSLQDRRIFEDEVYNYNNQIRRWVSALTHNERCKVMVNGSTQEFDRRAWEQVVFGHSNSVFEEIKGRNLDTTDYSGAYLAMVDSLYDGGWLIQNYSIGAGADLSVTESRNYTSMGNGHLEQDGFIVGVKGENGGKIAGVGVEFEWEAMIGFNNTDETGTEYGNSSSVTYNVSISPDEALTFDVYQAPDGFGPIFSVRGGQTICPYQDTEVTKYYEPGTEINTATIPLGEPRITAQNPIATNVPNGKKAIYTVELANTATPDALVSFMLRQDPSTNPNGAVIRIDGKPLDETGTLFNLSGGDHYNKVIELTQTREDILDYDSIALIFHPDCYLYDADTIWISAHFVETCSEIKLSADKNVLNNTTGNTIRFTIKDFEQDFRNLAGIQLQYQSEGDDQWHLVKQFPADSAATIRNSFSFTKPSFPDGTYRFKAVTLCQFGNETVNNESNVVTVVVDMQAPEALGLPYPIDGIYTANNQIYVDFSETIQPGRVLDDNVVVEGVLNAHEVNHSVSLNLENNTAVSNATYMLGSTPFTIEMWLNYTAPGTIFSYAAGSNSGIQFAIDASNHLTATINGTTYTSVATMVPNRWSFIVIQCDVVNKVLDATYSYDDQNVTLFYGQGFTQPASSGNIRFGGNGLNAKMHDVALWKRIRTTAESLAERSESKSPYTPDIMSLWRMDEGKGTVAKDDMRQRHLTLTDDAWAYSHVNYAMHVAAGDSAMVNISECPIEPGKCYLFEMWFRAAGNAELFHLADGSYSTSISNGNLVIENHTLPMRNYQANTWHHLAIINPKISTPVVAIDGEQLSSASLRSLPGFASSHIILGDAANSNDIDIDEVRLWNINTTLQATKLQMGNCLTGEEDGLLAYYPMEAYYTDPVSSQISTIFTMADKTDADGTRVITHSDMANAQSVSVPALVESRPTEYVAHTYTTSDNRIVVNITEPAQRIEGCWLEISVNNIVDANGNYSEPIRWTAFVNRNQLVWDENSFIIVKDEIVDTTFNLIVVNNSSVVQNWNIDNVPSCMTLSETSGRINPLQTKTITCTIDATADRGETEYILNLSGNENMDCPLYVTTKVYANKPDWNINPSWYEHSMNIIAYAEVDGVVADDSEDMMAAYVNGQLAGVAHLQLLPAMGRYYIMMTIFQNTPQNAATPRYVTFRYWDASTGLVYSNAQVYQTSNNGATQTLLNKIAYQDNLVLGSTVDPIRIVMGNEVQQTIELGQGWNWVSFNVNPPSTSFSDILGAYVKKFSIIKSQTDYAVPDTATRTVRGSIGNMNCALGYKIKAYNSFDVNLQGMPASLNTAINLAAQKWTWFGYLPQKAMTTNSALSNINPAIGDIVKSLTQFATWDGYQWVGSLKVMRPGQSYIYRSYNTADIQFTYPDYADVPYLMPSMLRSSAYYFNTVDPGDYQGNMNITATVTKDGNEVTTAEIGVFAGTECHGAATYDDGYYFITVSGDTCTPLTIKVLYNDSIYTLQGNLLYQNDAVVGSITTPFVIDLTTGLVPDVPSDPNDPYDPNNRENPGDNPGGDNPGENPGENPQVSVVNVEAANGSKVEKVLIENEVFIIKDGQMYDALGRRRK